MIIKLTAKDVETGTWADKRIKILANLDALTKKLQEQQEAKAQPEIELEDAITDLRDILEGLLTAAKTDDEKKNISEIIEKVMALSKDARTTRQEYKEKNPPAKDGQPSKMELPPMYRLMFESDKKFESVGTQRYKKELIAVGNYSDPRDGKSIFAVTLDRMQKWVDNFKKGVKRVPVPLSHSNEPTRNTGWVVDLAIEGDKLVGIMEFTNKAAEQLVMEGSIKDASICIEPNFLDTKNRTWVGEVLDHVALTVMPFITNLSPFEKIAAGFENREVIEMKQSKNAPANSTDPMIADLLASNRKLQESVIKLEREGREKAITDMTKRVETLVEKGTVPPGLKARVLNFALENMGSKIQFEKKDVNTASEFIELLEGMKAAFSVTTQLTDQDSQGADERVYLEAADFARIGDDYKKFVLEGKIKHEESSGKAYWTDKKKSQK